MQVEEPSSSDAALGNLIYTSLPHVTDKIEDVQACGVKRKRVDSSEQDFMDREEEDSIDHLDLES